MNRGFWSLLGEQERIALCDIGERQNLPTGALLGHEGDPVRNVTIIIDGYAKASRSTKDGMDIVVGVRGPGDLVQTATPWAEVEPATVSAISPLVTLTIDAGVFATQVSRRPRVGEALMRTIAVEQAATMRHQMAITVGGDRGLAATLLDLADMYGEIPPLRRDELGAWLGVSRETLVRAVSRLTKRGMVLSGRRDISIRNEKALRAMAGPLAERELNDRIGEAESLVALGRILKGDGSNSEAIVCFQEALVIQRRVGHRRGEAESLGELGELFWRRGRYPQAYEHLVAALTICRDNGERYGEATALDCLGRTLRRMGRIEEAFRYGLEAVDLRHELGDRAGHAASLDHLARAYSRFGLRAEALAAATQSLELRREIGDREGEAASLDTVARILWRMSRFAYALDTAKESLAVHRETAQRYGEVSTLDTLARVHLALNDLEAALLHAQKALDLARSLDDPEGLAQSLRTMALIRQAMALLEEEVGDQVGGGGDQAGHGDGEDPGGDDVAGNAPPDG